MCNVHSIRDLETKEIKSISGGGTPISRTSIVTGSILAGVIYGGLIVVSNYIAKIVPKIKQTT